MEKLLNKRITYKDEIVLIKQILNKQNYCQISMVGVLGEKVVNLFRVNTSDELVNQNVLSN